MECFLQKLKTLIERLAMSENTYSDTVSFIREFWYSSKNLNDLDLHFLTRTGIKLR